MEKNMFNRKIPSRILLAGCILMVVLSACIAPRAEDQISIMDKKQTQGQTLVKTLQANNCSGTEEMKQEMKAVHQYTHTIEITPAAGVSVNKMAVEDEIRTYYGISKIEDDAVCVVPVQIPAGAYYTYDLEWVEVWREGSFELGKPDDTDEGTYRFLQSMLCEVVAQRAETCPAQ
jgi:hypothetical protein